MFCSEAAQWTGEKDAARSIVHVIVSIPGQSRNDQARLSSQAVAEMPGDARSTFLLLWYTYVSCTPATAPPCPAQPLDT